MIGYNWGTSITNCYVIGNVNSNNAHSYSGENYIGGLIGYNYGYDIVINVISCYVIGDVSGTGTYTYIGGLIGRNRHNVSDCYVVGNISGSNSGGSIGVGGLIGHNSDAVTNCYTNSNVSSTGSSSHTSNPQNGNFVGGLIGYSSSAVTKCYATGDVNGSGSSFSTCVGGLIGDCSGYCFKCYAIGNVSGSGNNGSSDFYDDRGNHVGGLIGYCYAGRLSDCYATGDAIGNSTICTSNVGGLIGYSSRFYNSSGSSISNCFATGKVSSSHNVGGFLGNNYGGTINNCFFDYQTTGQIYGVGSGSGTVNNLHGKTTAEMKTKTTFTSVDWDFATIWGIDEGVTYPYFIDEQVAVNDLVQNVNIQLFPNPTTGELKIESGELKIEDVEIFDIYGKQLSSFTPFNFPAGGGDITSSSPHKIDISHLSAGVYFVKIYTEKGEVVRKVVKE